MMLGFLVIFERLTCGSWTALAEGVHVRGCGRTREEARAEVRAAIAFELARRAAAGERAPRPEVSMRAVRTDRAGRIGRGCLERLTPATEPPPEPARASLRELVTLGRLGPVRIGSTRDEVLAAFGLPESATTGALWPADGSGVYWRYGDAELLLESDRGDVRVVMMFIEVRHAVWEGRTRKLALDPWILRAGLEVSAFLAAVGAEGIEPVGACINNEPDREIQASLIGFEPDEQSWVSVHFDPQHLPEEERTRASPHELNQVWAGRGTWGEWVAG